METIKFVALYARKYKKELLIAVVSMIGLVGVQLVSPWIVRELIGLVQDQAWSAGMGIAIRRLAFVLLGAYVLRFLLQFLRNYMAHVAGWGVVADARHDIYERLQRLSLNFYENQQVGELMSRMVNDSDKFERLIAHAIPDVLVNILMLIGVVGMMLSMNWKLMLLTMIPVPLVVLAMQGFGQYVRPAFRERQEDLAELNATINDNLSGVREIKAFTREPIEQKRVWERIQAYRDSMIHALRLMAIFSPGVEFASSLGTVIVIYFGGRLAFQQTLPLEDLVAFFLYLDLFYRPVRVLSRVWEHIQEALSGAERVEELLEEDAEITEKPDAVELTRVEGTIKFHNVGFSYEEGEKVLEDINLEIPAKTALALVGPTGVGKTTLAALVPRFYDVTEGFVTIDGYDIRDVTLKSLRQQISMVLQDVFLFHGTVKDNILFGRSDATEDEVIEAAKIANAHDFIMDLPDGYDTMVGEHGVKLSGGQKQRVSIARAVLKDAPILILDEATSSVDTETEILIQQALERLMEGKTTIVIAHRLSTVRYVDFIVVLKGTGVLEQGSHERLMRRDGLYKHLWEVQSKPMEELVPVEV